MLMAVKQVVVDEICIIICLLLMQSSLGTHRHTRGDLNILGRQNIIMDTICIIIK